MRYYLQTKFRRNLSKGLLIFFVDSALNYPNVLSMILLLCRNYISTIIIISRHFISQKFKWYIYACMIPHCKSGVTTGISLRFRMLLSTLRTLTQSLNLSNKSKQIGSFNSISLSPWYSRALATEALST